MAGGAKHKMHLLNGENKTTALPRVPNNLAPCALGSVFLARSVKKMGGERAPATRTNCLLGRDNHYDRQGCGNAHAHRPLGTFTVAPGNVWKFKFLPGKGLPTQLKTGQGSEERAPSTELVSLLMATAANVSA